MPGDIREAVLLRLADLIASIGDFTFTDRNLDELPAAKRPCCVLIDGDEVRSPEALGRNGQPIMMEMSPVLAIGASSLAGADLGPTISSLRSQVIKAVLFDAGIAGIINADVTGRRTNSRVMYDGLTGKLSHASLINADAELRFVITYPLKPADL